MSTPRRSLLPTLQADAAALLRGAQPARHARLWPHALRERFPGRRKLLEAWTGEGAAFARYASDAHGPLFLKYLPAGWRDARAWRRLEREAVFLRDLAPGMPVPHAPLLHAALDRQSGRAHLLTRDLTDSTTGWGAFPDDPAREAALHGIAALLAQFHAHWLGEGRAALQGRWGWAPDRVVRHAQRLAAQVPAGASHARAVQGAARELPALLAAAPLATLVHGDIHAGQVLWGPQGQPVLIDYGQVHASVPGEDLAHLLAVRLNAQERLRMGPALRETYRAALAQAGVPLSHTALRAQERAGLALNLLSTARQAEGSGSGAWAALENVRAAWEEGV